MFFDLALWYILCVEKIFQMYVVENWLTPRCDCQKPQDSLEHIMENYRE
jgi:hypothetical protein